MKRLFFSLFLVVGAVNCNSAQMAAATRAINSLGVDLLRTSTQPGQNALLSPYSIQMALAMTFAGAEGATREEMAQALHLAEAGPGIHGSFSALNQALSEITASNAKSATSARNRKLITLSVANRIYGQSSFDFRSEYLNLLEENYAASVEKLNFARNPNAATTRINQWVERQTQQRIRNLIPDGGITDLTRLVLVNAIYLRAPWGHEFNESDTRPRPFHLADGLVVDVPTMHQARSYGYEQRAGYTIVALPYSDARLQFVVLLPDEANGLAELEARLNVDLLTDGVELGPREVVLFLPRFKFEPPTLALGSALRKLGVKSAFNDPPGSADFGRMAAIKPGQELSISEVYHKTFISLDERETEVAAATAVGLTPLKSRPEPAERVEVRVDRPFLFGVVHRDSGAWLFLGRVTDPR
jgi:serpin B